jgi:hypothetical protein
MKQPVDPNVWKQRAARRRIEEDQADRRAAKQARSAAHAEKVAERERQRQEAIAAAPPPAEKPTLPVSLLGDDAINQVVDAWLSSMEDFAATFDIRTKDGEVVPFDPTEIQKQVFKDIQDYRFVQFLKGRQMFVTTGTVIPALHVCFAKPGSRVCVAAHDERSAMEIGQFYRMMYEGNQALRELMPLKSGSKGQRSILFANGSKILFGTANSEFWRGFPTHFAHMTEAAMYDNLGKTIASLGQTVPESGTIVIETTANGDNTYREMWDDDGSRYFRRFLCWLNHPEYVSDLALPADLTDLERDYITRRKLPARRASWWVRKRRSMPISERHLMQQEYPVTPEEAFLLSGDKYLKRQVALPQSPPADAAGVVLCEVYNPEHQYVVGIDVAAGSERGDFSTVVIGNVTQRTVAATMQVRLPTALFKLAAHTLLRAYGSPTTAVEVNTYGLDVQNYLIEQGVAMYRTVEYGDMAFTFGSGMGWITAPNTRPILYGAIMEAATGQTSWHVGDRRLAEELNALCYDKNNKPGAPKNGHDDLGCAFGIMVLACQQARPPERVVAVIQPWETPAQKEWRILMEGGQESLERELERYTVQPGDFPT